MSVSTRPLDQVMLWDPVEDTYSWVTPSSAARIRQAKPHCVILEESDPNFQWGLAIAGRKPVIFPPPHEVGFQDE